MIIQTIESERGDDELMISVLRVVTKATPSGDAVRLLFWPEIGGIFNTVLESGIWASPKFGASGGPQRTGWNLMFANDSIAALGRNVDGNLKFSDDDLRKIGLSGQMLASQMLKDALEAIDRMKYRSLKQGEDQDEWKIDTVIEGRKKKIAAERFVARKRERARYR